MICEKCNKNMIQIDENSVQGWRCPHCGWNILTTRIDKIYEDMTEYSIYIKSSTEIDMKKIKLIAKTAGVNYGVAKQMLVKGDICILKAKAKEIKETINRLEELNIPFEVSPEFKYL